MAGSEQLAVCPDCGQPIEVWLSDVMPQGVSTPPDIVAALYGESGKLPIRCDCMVRRAIAKAVRKMFSTQAAIVAFEQCRNAQSAYDTAAKWRDIAPTNFEVWVSGTTACLAPNHVRNTLASGGKAAMEEIWSIR